MRHILIAVALAAATAGHAQDAVQTDGDKYKVILENDCVRVLDYQDSPGQKTLQHRHPAFVLYALSAFQRTLTLPDATVLRRDFKPGDVMWSDAQTHIGENVGSTPTHVLIVEMKQQPTANCTRQ
ncbi:MAG: cytoplasmic protein [Proteobacteria bacterium]|nr:cytoplasmic protein [Pseudomonadota bacterium]MBS0495941.1 cytoplasmic protein [Pseudomonadota bacterium]